MVKISDQYIKNRNESYEYKNKKEIKSAFEYNISGLLGITHTESPTVEFSSRECKNASHSKCVRIWEGLGFQARCNCYCHTISEDVGRAHTQPISSNSVGITIGG